MFKDWKTTSAGLLAIFGAVVSIVYAAMAGSVSPELLVTAFGSILAGVGLMFAKDSTQTPTP